MEAGTTAIVLAAGVVQRGVCSSLVAVGLGSHTWEVFCTCLPVLFAPATPLRPLSPPHPHRTARHPMPNVTPPTQPTPPTLQEAVRRKYNSARFSRRRAATPTSQGDGSQQQLAPGGVQPLGSTPLGSVAEGIEIEEDHAPAGQ